MQGNGNERLRREAIWAARKEILNRACTRLLQFDVPFFLWKGVDFAFSLYEDPAERFMSDIDLLVHENYAGMASSLLVSGGFRRYSPGSGLFTSGIIGETKFSAGGFLLELHTHPLYHPSVLPGRIPPVSMLTPERKTGGYPAPGWAETALYTLINHADSTEISAWQERDIQLLSAKLDDAGWEKLAFLSVRSGWGERIASVLLKSGGDPPEKVVDVLNANRYKRGTRSENGTLAALKNMGGWQKAAFGAAVFYRALTGRKPGREG